MVTPALATREAGKVSISLGHEQEGKEVGMAAGLPTTALSLCSKYTLCILISAHLLFHMAVSSSFRVYLLC